MQCDHDSPSFLPSALQMALVLKSVNTKTLFGKFRFLCILLVSAPDFELIVILLIFANCCSLAMLKPMQGKDSPWNKSLSTVELVLNACFTFEILVRTVAMGGILVGGAQLVGRCH
jgi:hypothetical protein